MLARQSKCSLWLRRICLLVGDALVDQSQTCQNPSTMQGATFLEVLKRVEEMTHLQVCPDWRAFTDAGFDLKQDTIVTIWLAGETVAQLTNHRSESQGVDFAETVHDGVATLTTAGNADVTDATKQYLIGDLLSVEREPRALIDLLQDETSGPWNDDEPGTGSISVLKSLGVLTVRQTQPVHRQTDESS